MKVQVAAAIALSAVFCGHAAVGSAADRDRTTAEFAVEDADDTRHEADNTGRNRALTEQSDDERAAATAEDQASSQQAIEVTRNIRRQVVDRDDFSSYAKNVKIITDDSGTVTLRGPVRNEKEKNEIERIARSSAGGHRVNNQIEVARNTETEGEEDGQS